MTIELDDGDRALLRDCPFTLATPKGEKPNKAKAARLKRIRKLWAAGLIHGDVDSAGTSLRISLKNAGRALIGRALVPEGDPHA